MYKLAVEDLLESLKKYNIWFLDALIETKQKYRRSVLGPLWISLSLAIFVFTIGFLWSTIFKIEIQSYLPYFCVGFILWSFISSSLIEASGVFAKSQNIIKQINLPLSFFIFSLVAKQLMIFLHNFIVFIIISIIFKISFIKFFPLIIIGLFIYIFTTIWFALLVGIISTRFRDVEQIIPSILQIAFFTTPIIWKAEFSGKKAFIVDYNPVFHFIEILRGPLLGYAPSAYNYLVVGIFTLICSIISFVVFAKYRKKIAYWI